MTKIEEIEQLLNEWKADIKPKKHGANKDRRRFAMGVISGLESALAILKRPSNTQMHMDSLKPGEPCSHPGCCNHITHPCEGCGRVGCQ